jgi:hypothetical protein
MHSLLWTGEELVGRLAVRVLTGHRARRHERELRAAAELVASSVGEDHQSVSHAVGEDDARLCGLTVHTWRSDRQPAPP